MRTTRIRVYVELTLATVTAALFVLTLAWREWIEELFGVDPDGGNGSLEWAIVAALAIVTVTLSIGARRDWKRLSAARA